MVVTISNETKKAIDQMIASGQVQSPEEALELMASFWLGSTLEDEGTVSLLRAKLQQAYDDVSAGRVTVLEGEQALRQHRDHTIAHLRTRFSGNNAES